MGSVVWSADTLIVSFLQPAVFAYNGGKYKEAATLINALNDFFLGFGCGIADLKPPTTNNPNLGNEFRRDTYSKEWYEIHFPAVSKAMGIYLRETLDTIKIERGTF